MKQLHLPYLLGITYFYVVERKIFRLYIAIGVATEAIEITSFIQIRCLQPYTSKSSLKISCQGKPCLFN